MGLPRVIGGPQPRPPQVILYCSTTRRSSTPKTTHVRNVRPSLYPPPASCPNLTVLPQKREKKKKKARIPALSTLTRLTHVANAGIGLESHLRHRARGTRLVADQRARASLVAPSSARCPHSGPRKPERSVRRRLRPVVIP